MKQTDDRYRPGEDYRELFDVTVDPQNCTDDCIGLRKDGTFLYIREKLANSSSAYWMEREFYLIDREEFREFLDIAGKKGEIEKAVRNGRTTEEELDALSGKAGGADGYDDNRKKGL